MRTLLRPLFCAALLASPAAMAGVSGNAGAVSEYLFRGVEQSNGTALQGGLDWSADAGFYAGTWVSNTLFPGYSAFVTYETDFYAGFSQSIGDFGYDVGLLYYYYRDDTALNTLEVYAGASLGPVSAKVFYTPEYFGVTDTAGDDVAGMYLTLSAEFPLSDTLSVTPQIGLSSGDGPKGFLGDEYTDYSVTLAKSLDNGFGFTLAIVGTDLDNPVVTADDEKVVLGLKKSFDL